MTKASEMVEKVARAIEAYFRERTGFGNGRDEEGQVSAYYGGHWITLNTNEIAIAAISAIDSENERLRAKYEGVLAGSWFYPEGDTSSDACCNSPHEVLDERYFDWDGPRTGVFTIERAVALPNIYAAVHAYTDAEKDEREADDDYDVTFHATLDEARAALSSPPAEGEK